MRNSPLIDLSVIAPAHDEEENVLPLIEEIDRVLDAVEGASEIVMVDDGSTDGTLARLTSALDRFARLRVIRMRRTPAGRGNGQSAAFHAALRAARGGVVAMLDADCQNDPADIPKLLDLMERHGADMVQGDRSGVRRDSMVRRASSVISRGFRRVLLGDSIRDTGCSLRVIRRAVALQLPLQYRGQHRFIPMTLRHMGYTVIEAPVNHRPRVAGVAKYGVWNRALPGLIDCFAVRWMRSRHRSVEFDHVEGDALQRESAEREPIEIVSVNGAAARAMMQPDGAAR